MIAKSSLTNGELFFCSSFFLLNGQTGRIFPAHQRLNPIDKLCLPVISLLSSVLCSLSSVLCYLPSNPAIEDKISAVFRDADNIFVNQGLERRGAVIS